MDWNNVMTFKPFFIKLKDVTFEGVFVFCMGIKLALLNSLRADWSSYKFLA
jgi:hypothetical protein